ncbi:hypothetical protein [Massilia sp. TN1-12]|uniref:hypothetical protein n=1 Tax=Massilia paldalensis TaxID=3377675 RepID=UPI003850E9F0
MEELDFGFFFCRVCHFYSTGYEQAMRLPLKTFWLMSSNIDRIEAKKDMRAITVAQMAQATPDGVQKFRDALVIEAGEIVKLDGAQDDPRTAKRDEAGFADLKRMAGEGIGSLRTR